MDFSQDKIRLAVQKAFIAMRRAFEDAKLDEIVEHVVLDLEKSFPEGATPSVENVQDLVEKELMKQNFFDIAKSYIIYRYEHAKEREEKQKEILEKIEQNDLTVIKHNGKEKKFSIKKLRGSLEHAISGFEGKVAVDAITKQCESDF